MNKAKRKAIFSIFQDNNPQPTTELEFHSPFELLVAVILSAQATDLSVNKATRLLFPVANTPEGFVALGEERLSQYLNSLNYYKTKSKNLMLTAQQLIEKYDSTVPSTRAALEALPGVGRKTANVILNTLFGEPTIAVDTHIFRVANRTGLAPGKTPLEVEKKLLETIPKPYLKDAHHWLVLHGRYVCKAQKPLCLTCKIAAYCEYPDKTR